MATITTLHLHLMILSFLFAGAGGYYYYRVTSCFFTYSNIFDIEFIDTYYFNKVPFIQYNSTKGIFVGFTDFGISYAKKWNSDPNILDKESALMDNYCKPNKDNDFDKILTKTVQPKVKLRSEKKASGNQPAILMCSAYDFYPPAIKVSWLKDGKPVTTDVTATEEMPDGDWYYQIHTHLIYTPKSGEKISCMVEHASFQEPQIYDWHGSDY